MQTVLVTGASGFVGSNLCARLEQIQDVKLIRFDRNNTEEDLKNYCGQADFIFHIAGTNRPKNEADFDTGNHGLTEKLLSYLSEQSKATSILLTSSIQATLENPYGKSKRAAEESVVSWAKQSKAQAYIFRLPNVFGKWSRPNYNSVVATFCNNIATNQDITINDPKAAVTLVYIDDVVNEFIKAMLGEKKADQKGFCDVGPKTTITLKDLASKLYAFKESRSSLVVPNFEAYFDRCLYATFTSFLAKDDFGYPLEMKHDERGWLSEFIKSPHAGQVFLSRTKPGIARGNHWHNTKIEKFLVIDGEAKIHFRLYGSEEIITYAVSGKDLRVVDIPAGYVHSITNTGDTDLLTLFWSDEVFDKTKPDTYYMEV